MWDLGHSCVKGNITADDFSRLGTGTAPVGPELIEEICESLIKSKLRDWTHTSGNERSEVMLDKQNLHQHRKCLRLERSVSQFKQS